jgi:hypothetical protein
LKNLDHLHLEAIIFDQSALQKKLAHCTIHSDS